ncbi:Adenylate cyclase 1 [Pseudovibrio axinellae]|uniref:Adenylate cyclase 1 n=1 Tax=Pseudovibrio axinellae TaxID=989403 RepID=A0A161XGP6_9HYPH|nr:adenylate/guanylate cyclase domain-containing protein [Pseudovibrio axinellae]KZL21018.1 Adenylate cyclase 1 [Pseudovibrio axinellae]SEP78770.1 adenylate cyclase [Pseudovibrio axinellae]
MAVGSSPENSDPSKKRGSDKKQTVDLSEKFHGISYQTKPAPTFIQYLKRGVLGPKAPEGDLPIRVRREVARQEAASERLIGIVQLGVIIFFAILYALAPRAEGTMGFNFVPIAFSCYLVFTLIRIYVSFTATLPVWYLVLSIMADVALLVGLIFSFHIQYGQHPTFYLKAPTLMYLFLFISLRALRFDPRYVILTGVFGALGWVGLVFYALMFEGGATRVTRNYVEYLTGEAVLIGAELDKLIIILSVTALLALSIFRARRTFFSAIRQKNAVKDLSRFFTPEVASSIVESESRLKAGTGEIREVAILVVDIRSFTKTAAKLPPETIMRVLSLYQKKAAKAILGEGGKIDKFLGDGILATFGAVSDSETYAADALRAGVELAHILEEESSDIEAAGWPRSFEIGVGVAAGPVSVGVVGVRDRLEFTVIGDAVNRAAKLEAANKVQSTRFLTDGATYSMALRQGYKGNMLDLKSECVAGINGKVDLVALA